MINEDYAKKMAIMKFYEKLEIDLLIAWVMYAKLTERRLEMLQQCSELRGRSLVQAHNEAVELYTSAFPARGRTGSVGAERSNLAGLGEEAG